MDDYPLLNVFWTMMWFFIWVLWLMLLFRVIADVFRDDSSSGWAKAGWTILVVVVPFLGVFAYLVARGEGMGRRESAGIRRREQAYRYNGAAEGGPAGNTGHADELGRLADLKGQGELTADEYERAKAKVLAI
ncbi:SHOCT domain-containing protein [Actinomadura sp. NTSP31]|uniref:SHOCT domain-containing protein n=1 Tax=Actinomadura sp. NTSP31 TaxID=1735447 RepID=UPI0035BF01EA